MSPIFVALVSVVAAWLSSTRSRVRRWVLAHYDDLWVGMDVWVAEPESGLERMGADVPAVVEPVVLSWNEPWPTKGSFILQPPAGLSQLPTRFDYPSGTLTETYLESFRRILPDGPENLLPWWSLALARVQSVLSVSRMPVETMVDGLSVEIRPSDKDGAWYFPDTHLIRLTRLPVSWALLHHEMFHVLDAGLGGGRIGAWSRSLPESHKGTNASWNKNRPLGRAMPALRDLHEPFVASYVEAVLSADVGMLGLSAESIQALRTDGLSVGRALEELGLPITVDDFLSSLSPIFGTSIPDGVPENKRATFLTLARFGIGGSCIRRPERKQRLWWNEASDNVRRYWLGFNECFARTMEVASSRHLFERTGASGGWSHRMMVLDEESQFQAERIVARALLREEVPLDRGWLSSIGL